MSGFIADGEIGDSRQRKAAAKEPRFHKIITLVTDN
jgi:hypothetical protein